MNISLDYYELILTENCNMRCSYCFDDNYSDRIKCSYDPVMKIDQIDNIFSFIIKTYDKSADKIIINFFGGEPLLNFEFIKEFVNRAQEELKEIPFYYTTNTNLLLITKEIEDFIIKYKFGINISLDGKKESHDLNRVLINKEPTWEKTMKILPEFIVKYRASGMMPGFLMVVNENNYKNLVDNYKFLLKLSPKVNILFNTNSDLSDDFFNSVYDSLEDLFIKNNNILPIEFSRKYLNVDYIKNDSSSCFIPEKNVTINPSGKLFYCHQVVPKMYDLKDFDQYYGDIINGYTNEKYLKNMIKRTDFNYFKKDKICETCDIGWCKGGCFGAHLFYTKDTFGINPNICKLNRKIEDICIKIRNC